MVKKSIPVASLLALVFVSGDSYAYFDPGTGSILIQGLIATIAATGVVARMYWHRFVTFFRPKDKAKLDESSVDIDVAE